jgi:C1A family cysteine protease
MQSVAVIFRYILAIIICLEFVFPAVYASDSNSGFIHSTDPVRVTLLNASSDLPSDSGIALRSSPETAMKNSDAVAPRLAPVNPEHIAYTQKILKDNKTTQIAFQDSNNPPLELGFIPPLTNLSYTRGQDVTQSFKKTGIQYPLFGAEPYPSFFDLRTLSKVTPVRDQSAAGSCWAQATYASLESYLLPQETWDFSENNMKNLLSISYQDGFDRLASDGGNAFMSTAYLARWTGPVNETDDPYDPYSTMSLQDLPVKKHVQRVVFLPDRANSTDNNNIKSSLNLFGVTYTSMYYNGIYFNYTNDAYYFNYSFEPDAIANHAVAIVGWDDHFSRYNFTNIPPGDGAFIIKNSWGTSWGNDGYFYISYYDTKVGKNNALFTAENTLNYDTVYQYDPLGWINNFGGRGNSAWGANIFTSNSSEMLSAVSFYATDINTGYDLYIYKNPNNGPINTSGYSYRENGILSGSPGYYTKAINPGIILNPQEKFSVVINLTTPNTQYPLPVEHAWQAYSSHATAHPNESFYSDDGGQTWKDITVLDPTENICIKSFTKYLPPKASFSANVLAGYAPLTVDFTDLSTGSPKKWNWTFGDGSFNTSQNPSYTFNRGGAYTIGLEVTNAAGNDTLLRTGYIIVNGDNIGIFRNSTGNWYLDYNTTGIVDKEFHFGSTNDIPVIGDWNGDQTSDVGVFRPSNGYWYLNYYKDSISHKAFHFGKYGDIPVIGDWNGDQISDVGVFRPSSGYWYLDYTSSGVIDTAFRFGLMDDIPVTGDWDGDLISDAGIFRPSTGYWYLDTTKTGAINKTFKFGKSGDIPITGDWDGDLTSDAGIFRPSTGYWYLDYNHAGVVDKTFKYGKAGDSPQVGKWK